MRIRPTSVTVVGWILVVSGLAMLPTIVGGGGEFEQTTLARSPLPTAVHQASPIASTVLELLCGYFILRGRNWARYFYAVCAAIRLTLASLISPFWATIVFGVVIQALMVYLLFRRPASEFFLAGRTEPGIQNEMSYRQIAKVCFYIFAGIMLTGTTFFAIAFPGDSESAWMIIGIVSLVPLGSMAIGRALSPTGNGTREIGIVLLVSAAG